jgi:hypothetical protein
MQIPLGVANSVSYNLDYNPIDTVSYAVQSDFQLVQIYMNRQSLEEKKYLADLSKKLENFSQTNIYFHADFPFNQDFLQSDYRIKFSTFLQSFPHCGIIFHFDENEELDVILRMVDELSTGKNRIYLENYFQTDGPSGTEKNLRKFTAIFSLANSEGVRIHPVIDVPRFFHAKIGFSDKEALNWCYQLFNFFGNRNIPILLHLIDTKNNAQNKSEYRPIGDGSVPYQSIFDFIQKNKVALEGMIFEYLDKVNPLKSRDNLKRLLNQQ